MAKTSNALKIIEKINRTDLELQEMVVEASINTQVAQLIYESRIKAGLTQQQLDDLQVAHVLSILFYSLYQEEISSEV